MNKQQLFEFLDKTLENTSLEEKATLIAETIPNWLREYHDILIVDKKYCSGCKKYISINDFDYYQETSVGIEYCHSEPLEAKTTAIYSKCPSCGKRVREKILNTEIIRWL